MNCLVILNKVDIVLPMKKTKPYKTPTYFTWKSMIQRCLNKKATGFKNYGGRGIKICPEWIKDYNRFVSDMGIKPPETSLDRIDNEGPYSKDNCRWVFHKKQNRNTRRTVWLTYKGETKGMSDWCEELNLNYTAIKQRIERGWDTDRAFTERVWRGRRREWNKPYALRKNSITR